MTTLSEKRGQANSVRTHNQLTTEALIHNQTLVQIHELEELNGKIKQGALYGDALKVHIQSPANIHIIAKQDNNTAKDLRCDNNGRLYVGNCGYTDIADPTTTINLKATAAGLLNVDSTQDFGSVVTLKDNTAINGAYQFNSVLGDLKKRDKITLEVRSNSGATGWTCEVGFSMDGVIWTDTISNINAVPAIQQIVQVDVIAPYWRFVFINTGVSSNWTIKYIIS